MEKDAHPLQMQIIAFHMIDVPVISLRRPSPFYMHNLKNICVLKRSLQMWPRLDRRESLQHFA